MLPALPPHRAGVFDGRSEVVRVTTEGAPAVGIVGKVVGPDAAELHREDLFKKGLRVPPITPLSA